MKERTLIDIGSIIISPSIPCVNRCYKKYKSAIRRGNIKQISDLKIIILARNHTNIKERKDATNEDPCRLK